MPVPELFMVDRLMPKDEVLSNTSRAKSKIGIYGTGSVVLVDDDKSYIRIFEKCYDRSKVVNPLICVRGGKELISYLQSIRGDSDSKPSIIFLDMNMPGMNGIETLRKIREIPEYKDDLTVMILSFSESPVDIENAFEAGADAYYIKSNSIERMVSFLDNMIKARS